MADSGVPVAQAAKLLGVMPATVRTWMARGVLETVAGSKLPQVTAASLGEVLAAVQTIRAADSDVLADAMRGLEDRRTIEDLAGPLADIAAGDVEEVDLENLDRLFGPD